MAHVRTSMRPWEVIEVDDREAAYLENAGLLAPDQDKGQDDDPFPDPAPARSRSRAGDKDKE